MTVEWTRPRPGAGSFRRDAIGAATLAGGTAVSSLLYTRVGMYDDTMAPLWLIIVTLASVTLPLALRRRFPAIVAVIVSGAYFVGQQFGVPEYLFSNIALFVAIYTLGAWGRNRRIALLVRIGIIVAMFVWIAVNLTITANDGELLPGLSRSGVFSQLASYSVISLLTNALYFGGAYYFGNSAFAAARSRAELEARTAELAAERERTAEQAVALDRVQIARELHDVVAHHVSLMGVQAGAARRVLRSDPVQAAASLTTIEQSARSAVDELHTMLGTLRKPGETRDGADAASTSSSTRGVDQLAELVEATTAAGVPATLTIVGGSRPISSVLGFTLYRLAQEALTNARKHGGSGATVDVRLRYLDESVELEVADTGLGRVNASAAGHGQRGMLERVGAVGGTIEFGPRPRGGYLVRAVLPDTNAGAHVAAGAAS